MVRRAPIAKAGLTPTTTTLSLDPAAPILRATLLDSGGPGPAPQEKVSAYTEVGATGLRRHGGYVYEEILRELAGYRAIKIFKEMSENEPIIGALLFAIEMLVRAVEWDVKPAGTETIYLLMAKRVKENMEDMSHSWADLIIEILSMLPYGWVWHEVIYKIRQGEMHDPNIPTSRFDDGTIGWRKIPIRSQDSLLRWEFDSGGGTKAMIQQPPPDYILRRIPIEKSLLFRTKAHKNNPQGYSILRNAYVPWYFKRAIQRIEAIGVERDLAGMPTLGVPPRMLSPNASVEDKASLVAYQTMLTSMRRDEGEGFIYPLAYDQSGKELYKLQLLSTAGQRQFDTSAIIARYNQEMAVTSLADFILIGHGSQGSGGGKGGTALIDNKTEIFSDALSSWLDIIAATINRYEIPRLFRLNGWPTDRLPVVTHSKVEQVNLTEIGTYIKSLAGAGMPLFPDTELENILRRRASLPEKAEDDNMDANLGDDIDADAALGGPISERLKDKHQPVADTVGKPTPGSAPNPKTNGAAGPPIPKVNTPVSVGSGAQPVR